VILFKSENGADDRRSRAASLTAKREVVGKPITRPDGEVAILRPFSHRTQACHVAGIARLLARAGMASGEANVYLKQ
jgi:hypothetical protein